MASLVKMHPRHEVLDSNPSTEQLQTHRCIFGERIESMSAVTDKSLRMRYRIGRGEQGVLTFERYKSAILPLWRFRTPDIARKSADELWERFKEYDRQGDFVGMDITRKFIQM